jgi:glutaredoxin
MTCRCVPSVYVTVYGAPTSSETRDVQDFFDSKGVAFEEFDVSTDLQALQRLQELSGQTERPVIIINDRVFTGFDPSELESAVPSLF